MCTLMNCPEARAKGRFGTVNQIGSQSQGAEML
jgi:hypothetical protein